MKKFLSLILAVALCASLFVMPVSAESWAGGGINATGTVFEGTITAAQAGMYKIEADLRSNKTSDSSMPHATGVVKINDQVFFTDTYNAVANPVDFDFVGYAYLNEGANTVKVYSEPTYECHSYVKCGEVKATYCPEMEAAIVNVGAAGSDDAITGSKTNNAVTNEGATLEYTFDVPSAGIWRGTALITGNRTNTSKGNPKTTYNIDGKYYTQNAGIGVSLMEKGWKGDWAYSEIDLMTLYMAPRDDSSANPDHKLTMLNAESWNAVKILGIKWEKVGEYGDPRAYTGIAAAVNAATNAAEVKAAFTNAGLSTAAIDAYIAPEVVYAGFIGKNYLEDAALIGEYDAVVDAGKNADVKLMKDGVEISAIQNGALSVAIAREHGANIGTKVIAAIYEGEVLKTVGMGEVLYGGRETVIDLGTLAAEDLSDCELKVFYWNDLANAQPHAMTYKDFIFR